MTATAKKKKLTLSINTSLNQRLDFEAAVKGKGHDRSSIVEALIVRHICLPDDWQDFPDDGGDTPRRAADKPSVRHREKVTFYFSPKAARLLGLHAQLTEADRSDVVERLIDENVTPWLVYDSRKFHVRTRPKDRQSEEAEINPPVAAVA
jgi:hypothetical protein